MKLRKWQRLKRKDEPAGEVAGRMLRSRLTAVLHYLSAAKEESDDDVEIVHQLRVWTRRAEAAVDFCRPLLPKRIVRKLRRRLKIVRRACGEVRDADVFRLRLRTLKIGEGKEHLLAEVKRHREQAWSELSQAVEQSDWKNKLRRVLDQAEKSLHRKRRKKSHRRPFNAWATKRLAEPAKEFFERADKITDESSLHRFRISGKQLRYAMELAAPAMPSGFREGVYREIERVQEPLGKINDSRHFLAQMNAALAAAKSRAAKTQINRFVATERKRQRALLEAWSRFWTDARRLALQAEFKQSDPR